MAKTLGLAIALAYGLSPANGECPNTYPISCPSGGGSFNVCESSSLAGNIIFRCIDGCPQPGNCDDNLAGYPPAGVKTNAACWQTSQTTGDAQCTVDCVNVTAHNGTTFYPVGCSFIIPGKGGGNSSSGGQPSSTSVSVPTNTQPAPEATSSKASSQSNGVARPVPFVQSLGGAFSAAVVVILGMVVVT